VDIVSPAERSRMMAGIKGRNTKPEVFLRKLLHRAGFRFRLHRKDLPGRPDIVLPKYKTAIFVNGCFWHGHRDCKHFRLPKSRTDFWKSKIESNIVRDERNEALVREYGWNSITIWECELPPKNTNFENNIIIKKIIEKKSTRLRK
jgi:DNA mismatch endonuclease (patch repair protein)